jgi:hypothetical protein
VVSWIIAAANYVPLNFVIESRIEAALRKSKVNAKQHCAFGEIDIFGILFIYNHLNLRQNLTMAHPPCTSTKNICKETML